MRGSKDQFPPGKKTSWKKVKAWSKANVAKTPMTASTIAKAPAPRLMARHSHASRRAAARAATSSDGSRRRRGQEGVQDGPARHAGGSPRRRHRRAGWPPGAAKGERARAEEQFLNGAIREPAAPGASRASPRPQVGRGLRLIERWMQVQRRDQQQHDRSEDEQRGRGRRRARRRGGGRGSRRSSRDRAAVTRYILARRRRVGPTPPRASAPAPTSPRAGGRTGHLRLEDLGRLGDARPELVQGQRQQVLQAHDAGLQQQLLVGRAEAGQVQQQRLVAPLVDVGGRRRGSGPPGTGGGSASRRPPAAGRS